MTGGDVRAPEAAAEPDARGFLAEIGVEGVVGIALMIALLTVMGLAVFFRYVLNDSLTWSEELARYGLVFVTFLGCATAARRGSHIRVTLAEEVMPPAWARRLNVVQDAVTLVFVGYIAMLAVEISGVLGGTRSAAMQIPMSYVYAGIVIGFTLAALRLAVRLARAVRSVRGAV
jgi:TRAP-type C4-dicarboxylate transport system permease small subunit